MRSSRFLTVLPLVLLLAACGGSVRPPAGGPGASAPSAAVERYLQLANDRQFGEMGWVFGTRAGAYAQQVPRRDSELLMSLHSCLLRHQRFALRSERPVPGSAGAVQYEVALTKADWQGTVPFRVVQGPGERWFVEEFGIEVLTSSSSKMPQECLTLLRSAGAR